MPSGSPCLYDQRTDCLRASLIAHRASPAHTADTPGATAGDVRESLNPHKLPIGWGGGWRWKEAEAEDGHGRNLPGLQAAEELGCEWRQPSSGSPRGADLPLPGWGGWEPRTLRSPSMEGPDPAWVGGAGEAARWLGPESEKQRGGGRRQALSWSAARGPSQNPFHWPGV